MASRQHKNVVKGADLGIELQTILDGYSTQVRNAVDMLSEETVKRIADETKKTAPVGARKSFRRHIASGAVKQTRYT